MNKQQFAQGHRLVQAGKYEPAKDLAEKARNQDPSDPLATLLLATAKFKETKGGRTPEESLEIANLFYDFIRSGPCYPGVYLLLGQTLARRASFLPPYSTERIKTIQEAREALREAKTEPKYSELINIILRKLS